MKQPLHARTYWNTNAREWTAVVCCLGMIAGLFFSRVLLSVSMIVMLLNSLHPRTVSMHWSAWKKNAFALLCFAFFLTYLISGLWSSNKAFWLAGTINKLPFAILPFAFLSAPLYRPKYQRVLVTGIVILQILVIGYSLVRLGLNTDYYLEGYSYSRPLPTTKYNDHIRFSLSLVLSGLMICYLLFERKEERLSKWLRIFLAASLVLFIIYIHVLAAKTGLLNLYIAAIVYLVYKVSGRSRALAWTLAAGVAALPLIAYYTIPTFQTKVAYVIYEIERIRSAQRYNYTLSDEGRMITYEIGAKAIAAHPLLGVGAGDVMDEMKQGYARYYPEVTPDQQYGPINQPMFTALCVGIPLALVLIVLMLSPFFMRMAESGYLRITTLVMLLSCMVESMLELQFGVFAYLFFILFWISALRKQTAVNSA